MFIIEETSELKIRERNLVRVLFSMNIHHVANPEMGLEEARSYIFFFRNGGKFEAYAGLYFISTDRRMLYSYSENPFSESSIADVEEEARSFAEGLGAMLDEIDMSSLSGDQKDQWIKDQEFLSGKKETPAGDAEEAEGQAAIEVEAADSSVPQSTDVPVSPEPIPEGQETCQSVTSVQPEPAAAIQEAITPTVRAVHPQFSAAMLEELPPVLPDHAETDSAQETADHGHTAPPAPPILPNRVITQPAVPIENEEEQELAVEYEPVGDAAKEVSMAYSPTRGRPAPGLNLLEPEREPISSHEEEEEQELAVEYEPAEPVAEAVTKAYSQAKGGPEPELNPREPEPAPMPSQIKVFEEAVRAGIVKAPKTTLKKVPDNPAGLVSRQKEALARLMASF